MTEQQIQEMYGELGNMFVKIDADATRGLDYVRGKLVLCRAMQDRLIELQLTANRALSGATERWLVAQQEHELVPTADAKKRVRELDRQRQTLSFLAKMVKAQYTSLGKTSMDLRLLADLTKEQIKLGEIDPKEAGQVVDQTPGDITPQRFPAKSSAEAFVKSMDEFAAETPPPPQMPPTPTEKPISETTPLEPAPEPGVSFVPANMQTASAPVLVGQTTFNDPSVPPSPDRVPIPRTDVVSFDSFFTPQEVSDHGRHPTGAPF